MTVLDATIMNIALPSAQQSLHFTIVDRQWVVTAYALHSWHMPSTWGFLAAGVVLLVLFGGGRPARRSRCCRPGS